MRRRTHERALRMTAGSERVIPALCDAAQARVSHARLALAAGDLGLARAHLLRAQSLVGELGCSLDRRAGPEAADLIRLCRCAHSRLVEANLNHTTEGLSVALGLLASLGQEWAAGACGASHMAQGKGVAV